MDGFWSNLAAAPGNIWNNATNSNTWNELGQAWNNTVRPDPTDRSWQRYGREIFAAPPEWAGSMLAAGYDTVGNYVDLGTSTCNIMRDKVGLNPLPRYEHKNISGLYKGLENAYQTDQMGSALWNGALNGVTAGIPNAIEVGQTYGFDSPEFANAASHSAFAIAQLKAAARSPRGATGNPSPLARTNAQLIQDIATRAEAWGTSKGLGNGSVAGTLKHGYAQRLLNRYQDLCGDRGLSTEVRYLNGQPWQSGMPLKGSIRLDVVEGPLNNPTAVWDYKFGGAQLTPARISQIQGGANLGSSVPVTAVRP
jgi:hypothetical protein